MAIQQENIRYYQEDGGAFDYGGYPSPGYAYDYGYSSPSYETQYTTDDLIAAARNLIDQGYTIDQIRSVAGDLNLAPAQIDQVISGVSPAPDVRLTVPQADTVLPQYPTNMIGDQERVDRGGGVMDIGQYILPSIPGRDLRETIGEDVIPATSGPVVAAPVDQYYQSAQGDYLMTPDIFSGGNVIDASGDLTPVETYTGAGNFGAGSVNPNLFIGNEKGPEDYGSDYTFPGLDTDLGTVITYPTEGGLPTDIESGTQVATGGAVGIGGTGINTESDWGASKGLNSREGEKSIDNRWSEGGDRLLVTIETGAVDKDGNPVRYVAEYNPTTGKTEYSINYGGQVIKSDTRPDIEGNVLYMGDRGFDLRESSTPPSASVTVSGGGGATDTSQLTGPNIPITTGPVIPETQGGGGGTPVETKPTPSFTKQQIQEAVDTITEDDVNWMFNNGLISSPDVREAAKWAMVNKLGYTENDAVQMLDQVTLPTFTKTTGPSGPSGPVVEGPTGPVVSGPQGPVVSGPQGPVVSGPQGPVVEGPTGPVVEGPTGPVVEGPTGPVVEGPTGPVVEGPTGPVVEGPTGPVVEGPTGPTGPGPQGPIIEGPTGPTGPGPTGPTGPGPTGPEPSPPPPPSPSPSPPPPPSPSPSPPPPPSPSPSPPPPSPSPSPPPPPSPSPSPPPPSPSPSPPPPPSPSPSPPPPPWPPSPPSPPPPPSPSPPPPPRPPSPPVTNLSAWGVNPGWIGSALKPFYVGTTPTQGQYYWGAHPYMATMEQLANYNYVPGANIQPWGRATSAIGGTEYLDIAKFIDAYQRGTPGLVQTNQGYVQPANFASAVVRQPAALPGVDMRAYQAPPRPDLWQGMFPQNIPPALRVNYQPSSQTPISPQPPAGAVKPDNTPLDWLYPTETGE